MAITVPNTASTYTVPACVPNSANRWAILGFMPAPGGSGSVAFMAGTDVASNGSPLLPIVCAPGTGYQSPLINVPAGIMVASIAGGCAIVWLKNAS